MNKIAVVLIATATFVVGAIVGGVAVAWFYSSVLMEPGLRSAATAGASVKLAVLTSIRAGETEKATNLLESLLDVDILTLGVLREETKRDETVERAVGRAAEYRKSHPYRSGQAEVDQRVERVLSGPVKPTP